MIRQGWVFAWAMLVLGCGASSKGTVPARPDPVVVKRGPLEDRFVLTGEIEAVTSETLTVPKTPAWSLSIRWLIDDGAMVKKGDKVVEFDSSELLSTLEDKRLNVVRSEGELDSEVARATAALSEKGLEVERLRADLEKAGIQAGVPADLLPQRTYQDNQLRKDQARDALAKGEELLFSERQAARLDRSIKEVARDKALRELADLMKRLEELTLRAPRDGLVQIAMNRNERRKYLVGDKEWPGWVVASLPDLSAMQVRAHLNDVDDGAVKKGMAAECILDAYPGKRWPGTIQQVAPTARAEGRDAARRFFDVVMRLGSVPADLMRPGMSARVEVIRRRAEDALLLPRTALRAGKEGSTGKRRVRLLSGAEQEVEVEFCAELFCALRSGVLEGMQLLEPPAGGRSPI